MSLAHILQKQGLLTDAQMQAAIEQAQLIQSPLLHFLVNEKLVAASSIAHACANYFGLEITDLHQYNLDSAITNLLISQPAFLQYAFLPIAKNNDAVTIAISDPDQLKLSTELKFQLNLNIKIVFAPYDQLITQLNHIISQHIYQSRAKLEIASEISIIDLTNQLITDAIYRDASDIHCEPMQQTYRIRMRIDGILHEIAQFPLELAAATSSRIKIVAELDIAEKRLPQDGRFTFTTITGIKRDCRVNSCPTIFGEKIVIRLLNPNKNLLQIDELGLDEPQKQMLLKAIAQPQGLILVTGPTGSGKTITLYTALNCINNIEKNISTIEDPIEINLPGINQVNVNLKAGLNFSTALRAFLRQDPDVIMVGEIRDFETASMAIRAAHTGHLVLSTLHTNSATEALTRLINMGIEPFNLASTVILIVAQRLVRLICTHCHGTQCPHCFNGYKNRTAIFEVITLNQPLRELILANAPAATIAATAQKYGIQNLWQIGLNKVTAGMTDLREIHRVLQSQE